MTRLGLVRDVVDEGALERAVAVCRERGIVLPTFEQLADPRRAPESIVAGLGEVDPDAPHPRNLFRVHWFNGADRRSPVATPAHLVLPTELTGVAAPVVVLLGDRFPMIRAHKVLAAYACLVPRFVTGQLDPTTQRALWPSTGNYCRGGVAISRIMGVRGVAILPQGMSLERFQWLDDWVTAPEDVVRTPGTESNVKAIYDACEELERDPQNVVFNQFCELANHLVHRTCTAAAFDAVLDDLRGRHPALAPAAFVASTGSAGTLGAGDRLKERHGTKIVAAEAMECPTLLRAGFGEHNIQGIGDKHVPLIHNAMNTDLVAGVSDRGTDRLMVVFGTDAGRRYLGERRGVAPGVLDGLAHLGLSSIANVLASIRTARYLDLGPDDAVLTVATDGAELYASESERVLARDFEGGLDAVAAAEVFGEHVLGDGGGELMELTRRDRERIFNLGYFTWVEQRGISVDEFTARRSQSFWRGLLDLPPAWDQLIRDFNRRTGLSPA